MSLFMPRTTTSNAAEGVPQCVACGCHRHAAHGSSISDLQSLFGPLMESLRSDLQEFFVSRLEEVVHPFMAKT